MHEYSQAALTMDGQGRQGSISGSRDSLSLRAPDAPVALVANFT